MFSTPVVLPCAEEKGGEKKVKVSAYKRPEQLLILDFKRLSSGSWPLCRACLSN